MDDAEEFVEEFRKNEDIQGLLSRKEYFRKIKYIGVGIFIAFYGIWFILIIIAPDFTARYTDLAINTLIILIAIILLMLTILYLDTRRYSSTTEEIAYHEFAQAVDAYCSEPPDYQEWRTHLTNAGNAIFHQEAEIFSKSQKYAVLEYIHQIQERDINDPNDAYFEDFYEKILHPLLIERKDDLDDIMHKLEQDESTTQDFLPILLESGENIIRGIGSKALIPIVVILGMGGAIAVLSEPNYGFYFSIISFTILEYVRGGRD